MHTDAERLVVFFDEHRRCGRLTDAHQGLDRIGKLLDEPREHGEEDRHLAERL